MNAEHTMGDDERLTNQRGTIVADLRATAAPLTYDALLAAFAYYRTERQRLWGETRAPQWRATRCIVDPRR